MILNLNFEICLIKIHTYSISLEVLTGRFCLLSLGFGFRNAVKGLGLGRSPSALGGYTSFIVLMKGLRTCITWESFNPSMLTIAP